MLTKEQQEVVNIDFKDILLVNAYAGTGKTSTLIEFCKKRKDKKILYLAYNNSMIKEAEKKFKMLPNVSIKTIHSLAYNVFGSSNKERLGNLTSKDIQEYFNDDNALYNASSTLSLLKDFCNSGDSITAFCQKLLSEKIEIKNKRLDKAYLAPKLKEIWNKIIAKDSKIAYPHDFYLKEYQLSKPKLDYDFILVDEAQDINECIIDIVLAQKAKKVFIGDTYQSIYAFRGAVDSLTKLSKLENSITLFLTQSFRCPLSVANIANFYLLAIGAKKPFIGTKKELPSNTQSITILARNNATLFDYAINSLDKKIAWVGGIDSYNFSDLLDIQNLLFKKPDFIKNSFLKKFSDIDELLDYCDETQEIEWRGKLMIVFKYINLDIPKLIKELRDLSVPPKEADFILTTGHKSKGLEWECVEIMDDFIDLKDIASNKKETIVAKEELNLLYVAITRATQTLYLNEKYLLDLDFIKTMKKWVVFE